MNLNLQTSIFGLGRISIKASHKIVAKLIPTPKLLEKGGAKMGVVAKPGIATGSRSKIEGLDGRARPVDQGFKLT